MSIGLVRRILRTCRCLSGMAAAATLGLALGPASSANAQTGIPTDRIGGRQEATHPLCGLSRAQDRKNRLAWLDGISRREPAHLLIHAENIYTGQLDLPMRSLQSALEESARQGVPQAQYNLLFLVYSRWVAGEQVTEQEVADALAKVQIGTFRGQLAFKMGYIYSLLREHVLQVTDGPTLEGYRLAAGYGNADAAYRYVVGVLQHRSEQVAADPELRRYLKKLVNTLSGRSSQLMALRGVLWKTGFFEGTPQARAYYGQLYKRVSELMGARAAGNQVAAARSVTKLDRDAERLIQVQHLISVTIAVDYEFVCQQ